jgi:hypothetical protein
MEGDGFGKYSCRNGIVRKGEFALSLIEFDREGPDVSLLFIYLVGL